MQRLKESYVIKSCKFDEILMELFKATENDQTEKYYKEHVLVALELHLN